MKERSKGVILIAKNNYNKTVGNNIAKYRLMNQLTQTELAKQLDIAQSTLSQYETGEREMSYELICKVCSLLGIEPNELFSLI